MNDAVTRIRVPGTMPYDVVVGTGLLAELTSLLDGALRVAIVHPGGLRATADSVREDLASHGFEAHTVEVPDGEDAKTLRVAGYCWDVLGTIGFTRSDAIVGLGGGAVATGGARCAGADDARRDGRRCDRRQDRGQY